MALTQKDLREIKIIVGNVLETQLDDILEEKLTEKLRFIPTKDEFFSKMDEIMAELQAMREENTIGAHQLSEHEDRITVLEEIHPSGKHPLLKFG